MTNTIEFNRSKNQSNQDSYKIEIITTKELTQGEYFEITEAINQITDFFDKHMNQVEEAERKAREAEEKKNK